MPMSPGKDEDQNDFMHRCVPEMMGDGKREQDQAVAACLSMYREGRKSTAGGPLNLKLAALQWDLGRLTEETLAKAFPRESPEEAT